MAQPTSQLLDTHVHLWQPSRFHYHWMERGSALDRDFTMADLHEETNEVCVAGGILMEATNTPEEIAWLLDMCESEAGRWGVVGWIVLEEDDAPQQIAYYAQFKRFKGVRLNWLEARPHTETLDRAMQAIQERQLVVDVLPSWEHLPVIAEFMRRYSQIAFVLEHMGGVALTEANLATWRTIMRSFSASPNVTLKLSGYGLPSPDIFAAYIHTALDLFGAQRLMFGSNFPMFVGKTSYSEIVAHLQRALSNDEARQALFWETGTRVYGL